MPLTNYVPSAEKSAARDQALLLSAYPSGAFGGLFAAAARSQYAHYRQVVISAMAQLHTFNASRQVDVGDMQDLSHFDFRQVDFDELRQIFRQAAYFQLGDCVRNRAATETHTDAFFRVGEV